MNIDAHCHIDLYQNPRKILIEANNSNLAVLSMTNLPSHFELGYSYFKTLKKVRLALGMHPLMAEFHKKEFPLFMRNLHKTSYIGEVGLDFSMEGINTKDIQIETFTKILSNIIGQRKILSIHSRKAEREVLNLLKEYKIRNAIFHWYSGSIKLIDEIAECGFFFSVNSAMIKSQNGRKILQKIPKNFLLTETDGPFVQENNTPLKPGQVESVITFLSELWSVSESDVKETLNSNFKNLLKSIK
ncbi:Deoxyribonuclease TatD [Chryseobacterium taklimakanense]|uniref:Deoxyribonuclease TatD n=1 Tax=Chryseobacterium taklimakanense TaxID=536441 RepID=A0A239XXN8_9FLAO|nr:Qat anti-phage system TatD family nuclease QatD [Chryseobacterium taklimakanense]SNV51170.1 Deoxyribonuclease TatD [Chryseobacterium taklimakanense]